MNKFKDVIFYIPKLEELEYRKRILNDELTMAYNHSYGGIINFDESVLDMWYKKWIIEADKRFYRYILDKETNQFVGELAYYYNMEYKCYIVHLLIEYKYRNNGYGTTALNKLCEHAILDGINELCDDIAIDNPSISLFKSNGFIEIYRNDKFIFVKKKLLP